MGDHPHQLWSGPAAGPAEMSGPAASPAGGQVLPRCPDWSSGGQDISSLSYGGRHPPHQDVVVFFLEVGDEESWNQWKFTESSH